MDVIHFLEQLLYEVATALYLPVIAGCSLLVTYTPLYLGRTFYEAWQRKKGRYVDRESFDTRLQQIWNDLKRHPRRLDLEVERVLQAEELSLSHSLDRIRFVIKAGPALGLMGTLIPMGISLAALAEGNIPKMAGSMVTAFTATVAGLGSGVLAYMIALARERWVREDLREMAHAAELTLISVEQDTSGIHHLQEEVDDALAATT